MAWVANRGGEPMTAWLYRAEAKGIQGYVLGTTRMREIAGASALVDTLSDDAKAWIAKGAPGAEVIAAAAGAVTARFPDDRTLSAFASEWPMYCARTRPGLELVHAWVEAPGYGAPMSDTLRSLFQKLGAARMLPRVTLPEPGPLVERAGRTGLAAVRETRDHVLQDAGTVAKEDAWKEGRDRLADRLLDGEERFARGTPDEADEGYVGVVHIDGNRVGRWFQSSVSLADLSDRSRRLGEATRAATRAAIRAVSELRRSGARTGDSSWRRGFVPMRPVVLGGDDLTMIVRAADAIPFVVSFLRAFEVATRGFPGGALTAAAGIALVKQSFPYHAAYDLAEELCAVAKRADSATAGSTLMFHRVTTAAVQSWDDIVRTDLRALGKNGALVGGPWMLDDGHRSIERLREFASRVADRATPKGSLRAWLSAVEVEQGDVATRSDEVWRRMLDVIERLDEDGRARRSAVEDALRSLGCARDGASVKAWRDDLTTPVADALTWLSIDANMKHLGRMQ